MNAPLPQENILPQRPKRPLSAYNLFYRFKRHLVLDAGNRGGEDKENIIRLLEIPAGLEDYSPNTTRLLSPNVLNNLRRDNIRLALKNNLSPNETKNRVHRKSHGVMNFVEMSRIMCENWKRSDPFTKSVFRELSEEGRAIYRQRVANYKAEMMLSKSMNSETQLPIQIGSINQKRSSSPKLFSFGLVKMQQKNDHGHNYPFHSATENTTSNDAHMKRVSISSNFMQSPHVISPQSMTYNSALSSGKCMDKQFFSTPPPPIFFKDTREEFKPRGNYEICSIINGESNNLCSIIPSKNNDEYSDLSSFPVCREILSESPRQGERGAGKNMDPIKERDVSANDLLELISTLDCQLDNNIAF